MNKAFHHNLPGQCTGDCGVLPGGEQRHREQCGERGTGDTADDTRILQRVIQLGETSEVRRIVTEKQRCTEHQQQTVDNK